MPPDRPLGQPVPGWTPPPWPGPMRLDGRWLRLDPLTPAHAPALFAANRADDRVWDYLPYGPFADEAAYRAWVGSVAGKADPLFFALTDRAVGSPGGVASLMRISPEAGSIEVGHICLSPSLQRTRAASEMVFLLADWVFREGYRRFEWKCDALNRPSRRAARALRLLLRGGVPPASDRQGPQPRHRLVRDDRRRLGLPAAGLGGLARPGELRRGRPAAAGARRR